MSDKVTMENVRRRRIEALLGSATPWIKVCEDCDVLFAPQATPDRVALSSTCLRCTDLRAIGATYRCDGCGGGTIMLQDKTQAKQRACVSCDAELIAATVTMPARLKRESSDDGAVDAGPAISATVPMTRDASAALIPMPVVRVFVGDEMRYARVWSLSRTTVRLRDDDAGGGFSMRDGRADYFTTGEPRARLHFSDLRQLRKILDIEIGDGDRTVTPDHRALAGSLPLYSAGPAVTASMGEPIAKLRDIVERSALTSIGQPNFNVRGAEYTVTLGFVLTENPA